MPLIIHFDLTQIYSSLPAKIQQYIKPTPHVHAKVAAELERHVYVSVRIIHLSRQLLLSLTRY